MVMWFCCVGLRQKNELRRRRGLRAPGCWHSAMRTVSDKPPLYVGNKSVSYQILETWLVSFVVRWKTCWNCCLQFSAMRGTDFPLILVTQLLGSREAMASVTNLECNTPQETEAIKSSSRSFFKNSLSPEVSWYLMAKSMLNAYNSGAAICGPLFIFSKDSESPFKSNTALLNTAWKVWNLQFWKDQFDSLGLHRTRAKAWRLVACTSFQNSPFLFNLGWNVLGHSIVAGFGVTFLSFELTALTPC